MPVDVDLKEALGRLALFADFGPDDFAKLLEVARVAEYAQGERVVQRGDMKTGLFVLVEGEVSVVLEDEELAVLPRGSFFGEISVLLDEPVVADIIARTPLRCLVIESEHVETLLLEHPRVTMRMLKTEARRVRTLDEARGWGRMLKSEARA